MTELRELRDLPPEVRALVHAADRMRDDWAEAAPDRQQELWRGLHEAVDAVWGRFDKSAATEDETPDLETVP